MIKRITIFIYLWLRIILIKTKERVRLISSFKKRDPSKRRIYGLGFVLLTKSSLTSNFIGQIVMLPLTKQKSLKIREFKEAKTVGKKGERKSRVWINHITDKESPSNCMISNWRMNNLWEKVYSSSIVVGGRDFLNWSIEKFCGP